MVIHTCNNGPGKIPEGDRNRRDMLKDQIE